MARTWGTNLDFTATDTADVFTPGTIAVVARAGTPADGAGTLAATTSGNGFVFNLQTEGASDVLQMFDTVAANPTGSATTAVVASVWAIYGATYPSSGGTPRFHRSRLDDGTHAHENADATLAQPPAVGASGKWRLGPGEAANWSGQLAAAAYWPHAMGDGEFERLVRGNWASRSPKFLWESSARDGTLAYGRDLSRSNCKFLAHTGTTRYVGVDPAGFRFSAAARRV